VTPFGNDEFEGSRNNPVWQNDRRIAAAAIADDKVVERGLSRGRANDGGQGRQTGQMKLACGH
jgi:hypothetical protein